jgi:hypothetical protein
MVRIVLNGENLFPVGDSPMWPLSSDEEYEFEEEDDDEEV